MPTYYDDSIFKLLCPDVGLPRAPAYLDYVSIIDNNQIFTEFKGALTEQYVCQELVVGVLVLYYWSADDSRGARDLSSKNL